MAIIQPLCGILEALYGCDAAPVVYYSSPVSYNTTAVSCDARHASYNTATVGHSTNPVWFIIQPLCDYDTTLVATIQAMYGYNTTPVSYNTSPCCHNTNSV